MLRGFPLPSSGRALCTSGCAPWDSAAGRVHFTRRRAGRARAAGTRCQQLVARAAGHDRGVDLLVADSRPGGGHARLGHQGHRAAGAKAYPQKERDHDHILGARITGIGWLPRRQNDASITRSKCRLFIRDFSFLQKIVEQALVDRRRALQKLRRQARVIGKEVCFPRGRHEHRAAAVLAHGVVAC